MSTNPLTVKRPSFKANLARVGVVAASLALVGGLIVTQSQAAFTATTTNSGNAFNAATIALSGANGTAMFNVPAMVPGDVVTGCVDVTYTGTADPGLVKIYRNAYTETDGVTGVAGAGATLDDALTLKIDRVISCAIPTPIDTLHTGITLSALGTNYTGGHNAVWNPAPADAIKTYGYRVTATFTSSGTNATDNTRIGDTVSALSFTWETQAGTPGA